MIKFYLKINVTIEGIALNEDGFKIWRKRVYSEWFITNYWRALTFITLQRTNYQTVISQFRQKQDKNSLTHNRNSKNIKEHRWNNERKWNFDNG